MVPVKFLIQIKYFIILMYARELYLLNVQKSFWFGFPPSKLKLADSSVFFHILLISHIEIDQNYSLLFVVVELVTQLCLTLCDSIDCNSPSSSVHGILQARILEWVAIPFSRESSEPMDRTQVSCIAGRFFTIWATAKSLIICGSS